jgi:hypothetical protein
MKNLLVLILFSLAFSNASFSQQRETSELIPGLWIIDMELQKEALLLENKEQYQGLEDPQKERLMMTLSSRTYYFDKDGTFESSWVSGGGSSKVKGLWELDGKDVLTLDIKSVNPIQYRVEFLKERIALHPIAASESIVETIYLTQLDK